VAAKAQRASSAPRLEDHELELPSMGREPRGAPA
jgi:hypothetical protein